MEIADGEGSNSSSEDIKKAKVDLTGLTQTFSDSIESVDPETIKSWLRNSFYKNC